MTGRPSSLSREQWAGLGFLCLALSLFYAVNPFALTGPQLVYNAHFVDGGYGWDVSGRGRVDFLGPIVRLWPDESGQTPAISQVIRPGAAAPGESERMFLLRADAQAIGIRGGPLYWHRGRLLLVSYREGRPDYSRTHELFRIDGTEPWQSYSALFHLPADVDRLVLQIQLPQAEGELQVRDVQLFPAEFTAGWRLIRVLMIMSGLAILGALFRRYGSVGLIVAGLVSAGCLMPGSWSHWLSIQLAPVFSLVPSALAQGTFTLGEVSVVFGGLDLRFFSYSHFMGFALLTPLIWSQGKTRGANTILVDLLLLALITEAMQLYTPARHGNINDVLVNIGGVTCGTIVYFLYRNRRNLAV